FLRLDIGDLAKGVAGLARAIRVGPQTVKHRTNMARKPDFRSSVKGVEITVGRTRALRNRIIGKRRPQLPRPIMPTASQSHRTVLSIDAYLRIALRRNTAVTIPYIARATPRKTAGFINQSGGVKSFGPFGRRHRVMLSPTFIEHVPTDNAGMIPTLLD